MFALIAFTLIPLSLGFDPLPPRPPGENVLRPATDPRSATDRSRSGKCTLYNNSLPCVAGSECLPKTTCLFPAAPKGREFYCPCQEGTCANCLNETVCVNNTGCRWNNLSMSCYNDCNQRPCKTCLDPFACTTHGSNNCFWANYTQNNTGSCEPKACYPGSCHCADAPTCSQAGCVWTPDGKCTPQCAILPMAPEDPPPDPMAPACILDQAFSSASTTGPPKPDSKCLNPYFPWDMYWPDEEAPIACEEGECAVCHLGRYCPLGTNNPNLSLTVCDSGYYCPNASVRLPCPAGSYCPVHSVVPFACTTGMYCPANMSGAPDWCEKGYFCATPATRQVCPEGYYCLQGLAEPFPCPFASTCDEGSSAPKRGAVLGLTLATLTIILILFLGFTWARYSVTKVNATKHMARREERNVLVTDFVNLVSVLQGESVTFKGFQAHSSPPCTIGFEELSLKVGDKVILQGVSGSFPHSSLVAIMGPSGAGKTSFLNVLTGKAHYGQVGGKATLNGHQPAAKEIRHEVGFVPQDDIVNDILTVRDNISWSAWLRLPADMPASRKTDIVDDVIALLGLTHIQHSVVGSVEKRGISGGQRKRVNIGMELAADPTVLFLDEPTSGLDASSTQEILQRLREFSRLGISTAAVIHQPRYSAFLAFDYILLLGIGGRTVYLGSSQGALAYFQSIGFTCPPRENPADFFLDVVSGLIPCEKKADFVADDLFDFWVNRTWQDVQPAAKQSDSTLYETWRKFDVNGDGVIDVKELMEFFKSVGVIIDDKNSIDKFIQRAKKEAPEVHKRLQKLSVQSLRAEGSRKRVLVEQASQAQLTVEVEEQKSDVELPVVSDASRGEADSAAADWKKEKESDIELSVLPEASRGEAEAGSAAAPDRKKSDWAERIAADMAPEATAEAEVSPSITLEQLIELIQAPRDLTPSSEPLHIRKVPGFWRQFALFFMRDCVRIYREASGVLANCFLLSSVGTLLGVLYGGDWELYKLPEIALALATFASLFGGLLSINLLSTERLMNYREAAAGTNQHAYFLNKIILNLLYCTLHTTAFLLVFYPLINFPFDYKLLWAWVFLCFYVASGLGLLLAVIHRSPHVMVGVLLTVINLFLGGALVTLNDLGSAAPLTYISPARWLAELVLSYTLESLPAQWDATRDVLESQFQFYYSERQLAVAVLIIIGVVLRTAAYIAHFLWDRNKK